MFTYLVFTTIADRIFSVRTVHVNLHKSANQSSDPLLRVGSNRLEALGDYAGRVENHIYRGDLARLYHFYIQIGVKHEMMGPRSYSLGWQRIVASGSTKKAKVSGNELSDTTFIVISWPKLTQSGYAPNFIVLCSYRDNNSPPGTSWFADTSHSPATVELFCTRDRNFRSWDISRTVFPLRRVPPPYICKTLGKPTKGRQQGPRDTNFFPYMFQ